MRRFGRGFVPATLGLAILIAAASAAPAVREAGRNQDSSAGQAEIVWTPTPGPGKKCPINADYYFKYEFNERPKMGMVILKIQVFDKKGNQVVPYLITGRSDMPSMPGAHDSGEVEFKLNKKNDYLLPVNIVMPGDWEVRVVMKLNGQALYHGSIRFEV